MLALRVTARAERHIRAASQWWMSNRTAAPTMFLDELWRAFELLTTQPQIGSVAVNSRLKGIRRILLPRSQYVLYYRINLRQQRVEVIELWHTSRGAEPKL